MESWESEDLLSTLKFLKDYNKQGHQLRMKRSEERKGIEQNE